MKNKPLTIVLLLAVVGIWASILYSVFNYTDDPEFRSLGKKDIVSVVAEDTNTAEYVLQLNYKDPFLKKEYYLIKTISQSLSNNNAGSYTSSSGGNSAIKKEIVTQPVKEEIPMPVIIYVGRIHNSKAKKPIAILVIDNKEYMMQEGETQDGILLKQVMNDSIKAIFSKKVFYVKKQ